MCSILLRAPQITRSVAWLLMSKQSSRGSEWEAIRLRILNRDGWLCAYCGKALEGKDATVDHIVPKDAGGTDEDHNLVACCLTDNGRKTNKVMIRMPWFNIKWLHFLP